MTATYWLSPVLPASTCAARLTEQVVPCFPATLDVQVVRPDSRSELGHEPESLARYAQSTPSALASKPLGELSFRMLNGSRLCVYNVADDAEHYGQIVDTVLRHPGIVILHERTLHKLCQGLEQSVHGECEFYRSALIRWYGRRGHDAADAIQDGHAGLDETLHELPLFEVVLEGALGAVTHDPELAAEILERFPGLPVTTFEPPSSVGGLADPHFYAAQLEEWLERERETMFRRWSDAALIEAIARTYALTTPSRFLPLLPARLIS